MWIKRTAGVGLVSLVLALTLDRPLALALKAGVGEQGLALSRWLSAVGEGGWWYGLFGGLTLYWFAAAHFTRSYRESDLCFGRARQWFLALAGLAASGLVVTALKAVVGRARPRLLFRDGTYGLDPLVFSSHWNSFPSGHSQTIWAAMTAVMVISPRLRIPALTVATLVSLSRLTLTAHYLSDVLVGSFIGWGVVMLLRPYDRLTTKAERGAGRGV